MIEAMPRVVIADDNPALRYLWRLFLEEGGVDVVAEAATGTEAVQAVEDLHPDVLLLDLAMPEMDGLEVIPVAKTADPHIGIVIASGFLRERVATTAFSLGADRYFTKGDPPEELVQMVCELAAQRR
jgi:CheY-like chemotaxis protein